MERLCLLVLIRERGCKSIKKKNASTQTPFSVVMVPLSIPVSLLLPVPLPEIIVIQMFIMSRSASRLLLSWNRPGPLSRD